MVTGTGCAGLSTWTYPNELGHWTKMRDSISLPSCSFEMHKTNVEHLASLLKGPAIEKTQF